VNLPFIKKKLKVRLKITAGVGRDGVGGLPDRKEDKKTPNPKAQQTPGKPRGWKTARE
jgi:hypothetical protein